MDKSLECSHATGAHDEPCDFAALVDAAKTMLAQFQNMSAQDISEGRLKVILEKAEEAKREWVRAEKAEAELSALRVYVAHVEDDNAELAVRVPELVRCLGHERCSVCGQLYSVDPTTGMGCKLADHIEAYEAIFGKVKP